MINQSKKRVLECLEIFASLGDVRARTQFGGFSLSANGAMFALVSDGDLYLRASAETEAHFCRKKMERLIYRKRGMDVRLRYFKVNPSQWEDSDVVRKLGKYSLKGMLREIELRKNNEAGRLKDLPNLSLALERLLWQVGIANSGDLRTQGACKTYLKLCAVKKKSLGINLLMALEGAILGYHEAALPVASREILTQWFNHQQEQPSDTMH
ncbi:MULTISPECIES: TfoX/Sxy family DNA transformation protein [Rahnella]|uniref:TfoX/Sxy family DNA transformation protein n=1 Tax=Rahnella laticis TaxID=2787622 RepID=A0ABS0E202_9GAMM|nr:MULTISPECIES: TfoX/Sxy family DNA transformation protein [Rahnella]MBF7978030.1 TfoX/Sxy family DNA transformation protein [Rahnella laticis]MBF7998253.1 TfoX/Sxy family DNA transformation protein [Rahnella sp. LAC-M12]